MAMVHLLNINGFLIVVGFYQSFFFKRATQHMVVFVLASPLLLSHNKSVLSVLIPSLNQLPRLKACLASIKNIISSYN